MLQYCTVPLSQRWHTRLLSHNTFVAATFKLSNIPVRLAVDVARSRSALSRAHIVKHGVTSDIDGDHHLVTLTIQAPQICLSCPLTFVVVDDLLSDIALGSDWFHRTEVDVLPWFPRYHDYPTSENDHTLSVHADTLNESSAVTSSADTFSAQPNNAFPGLHPMTKTQLVSAAKKHGLRLAAQTKCPKIAQKL